MKKYDEIDRCPKCGSINFKAKFRYAPKIFRQIINVDEYLEVVCECGYSWLTLTLDHDLRDTTRSVDNGH